MNIQEFRLKNLAQNSIGEIIRIEELGWSARLVVRHIHDGYPRSIDVNEIQPIPLSHEWLVRAGFEWKNHGLRKDNFCIRQFGEKLSIFLSNESFNFEVKIPYVHQLQNLFFALTGKELEFTDRS